MKITCIFLVYYIACDRSLGEGDLTLLLVWGCAENISV